MEKSLPEPLIRDITWISVPRISAVATHAVIDNTVVENSGFYALKLQIAFSEALSGSTGDILRLYVAV